jgi:hypothetical protein
MSSLRNALVALVPFVSACGAVVAPPDALDRDAVTLADRAVPTDDRSAPVATDATDASVDSGPSRGDDAAVVVAADAAADAAVPALSRVVASGDRVCGVSLAVGVNDEFVAAWGVQRGTSNELRFARFRSDGTPVAEHLVASGGSDPLCVSRGSLALVDNGTTGRGATYALAWQRRGVAGGTIETALIDDAGAIRALGAREPNTIVGRPLGPSSLDVSASGAFVRVSYDGMDSGRRSLRSVLYNFSSASSGDAGVSVASVQLARSIEVDADEASAMVLGGGQFGSGGLAVWRAASARGDGVLRARWLDGSDWGVEPLTIASEPGAEPVSISGQGSERAVVVQTGTRSRSVRAVPAPGTSTRMLPSWPDTAWNGLDATLARDGSTLWTTHNGGGWNRVVLFAPLGARAPERCVAMAASSERATFTQVAHAQRASRDQALAGIVRETPSTGGAVESLHLRFLADGESACR